MNLYFCLKEQTLIYKLNLLTTPLYLKFRGGYVHIILWSYICPNICFKRIQFQGEISPGFGTDHYLAEIYERTILISQCSGFFLKRSLHVCVATSVSIRTNFKLDLICFPVHIASLSCLSQWLTILNQQLHLCPE